MDKADEEGFCLFVLEPAQGTPWGTLEEEQALHQCRHQRRQGGQVAPARSQHVPGGLRCHGYLPAEVRHGEPLNIAGAVFLDASIIDAGYMASQRGCVL